MKKQEKFPQIKRYYFHEATVDYITPDTNKTNRGIRDLYMVINERAKDRMKVVMGQLPKDYLENFFVCIGIPKTNKRALVDLQLQTRGFYIALLSNFRDDLGFIERTAKDVRIDPSLIRYLPPVELLAVDGKEPDFFTTKDHHYDTACKTLKEFLATQELYTLSRFQDKK